MAEPGRRSDRPRAYSPLSIAIATVATLAVIALGVVAGRWQHDRYEVRAQAVRAFDAAQGLPSAPLSELVGTDSQSLGAAQWRIATASGHFDTQSLTELRGRSVEGVAALHYLAWFITEDGALLVDVGWAPRASAGAVTLPTGELEIAGLLRAQEADDGRRGEGATRIVATQLPPPDFPADTFPAWLMLREPCDDTGCVGTALQPAPVPQLSLGPHLSYAYQWWLLALVAPFAAVFLLRRDARLEREQGEAVAPREPTPRRRSGRPSDEEIEDAL